MKVKPNNYQSRITGPIQSLGVARIQIHLFTLVHSIKETFKPKLSEKYLRYNKISTITNKMLANKIVNLRNPKCNGRTRSIKAKEDFNNKAFIIISIAKLNLNS